MSDFPLYKSEVVQALLAENEKLRAQIEAQSQQTRYWKGRCDVLMFILSKVQGYLEPSGKVEAEAETDTAEVAA